MSNIPENEKINNMENQVDEDSVENTPALSDEEEFSTIFSDPAIHRRTAPEKKKGYLLKILAGVLAVAILGTGTWAVIEFIPEMEEDVTSPYHEEITVKEIESDDFKTVTIKNDNGTTEFYSLTEKATDSSDSSDTSSETAEVTKWYIKGVDKSFTSDSSIATFIGQFGNVTAVREITEITAADCGLDKPTLTATAVCKDGTEYTLDIGKIGDNISGARYGKFSDSDKIYLLTGGYVDSLAEVEPLLYDATVSTPAFEVPDGGEDYVAEDGSLTTFDKLTVSGKNMSDEIVFKANNDKEIASMIGYVVTSPSMRIAQNAEYVLAIFKSGLSVDGAYAFDVSDKALKKFGLDKPDFTATLEILGKKMTYKFKLQKDGNCAVIADGAKVISKVSATTDLSGEGKVLLSSLLEFSVTDFYASWISLYNIADISDFKVNVEGKDYNFAIKANEDEEAEDNYIIKLNGKKIDCQSFQYLYQWFITMNCSDFNVDDLDSDPDMTVKFSFNKKNYKDSVIEFRRSGATRYQYTVDGINMGKTTSAEINKFVKYLKKVAAGEIISEIA